MALWMRFRALLHRASLDNEIQEELQTHIEMRTADNIATGMSPDAARRDALLKFGNPTAMKEQVAGVDAALGLNIFFRDVRYGFRQLRKSPWLCRDGNSYPGVGHRRHDGCLFGR